MSARLSHDRFRCCPRLVKVSLAAGLIFGCGLLLLPWSPVVAQKKTVSAPSVPTANDGSVQVSKSAATPPPPAARGSDGDDNSSLTPELETAAIKFAELHHPELLELLTILERSHPQKYRQAVQEIFRVSERLARMRDRQPDRYVVELKIWEVTSRLNLLIAALPMTDRPRPALEQIERLLNEKMDLETEILELQVQQTRDRLERMEQSLTRQKQERKKTVNGMMERFTRLARPEEAPQPPPSSGQRRENRTGKQAPAPQ